ncbi:MAG: RluA family pseudouridine synthase [bacterium]|nr:RluA family pseudouridine synthase [bacterium]
MRDIPVVYEDNDIVVINKPSGLLVHGTPSKKKKAAAGAAEGEPRHGRELRHGREYPEKTLVDWILQHYPETRTVGDDPVTRPGIVHRLDKETSGILIIARNETAFQIIKAQFQQHLIQKKYIALVVGVLKEKEGVINKPIGILMGSTKRSVHSTKMQKEAVTEYRVVKQYTLNEMPYTLLEVTPRTGRTHQIRVHLASINHPVVGDPLYGGKKTRFEGVTRQLLHAASIEFTTPSGKRIKLETELPPAFTRLYDTIK